MADKAMSDPYANPSGPGTSLDPAIALNAVQGAVSRSSPAAATPDFLFPENYDQSFRRSWGDRLTYHIGLGYLVGLTAGGGMGLVEGLQTSAGERQRIRINAVLNATGKRGPMLGNGLGCLAMMVSVLESVAFTVRGTDDVLNATAAGVLAGGIFRSTAGPTHAATAAIGLGAFTTAATLGYEQLRKMGVLGRSL